MKKEYSISVKLNNLNCNFGKNQVLHNINIDFSKNKFYTILGPNGSGKTTLLRNIGRTISPSKNTIFLGNKDILDFTNKDLAKRIAVVPQNTISNFDFSALDIVLMGRAPYIPRFKDESKEDYDIAKYSMKMTNTWYLRDKSINELSGGEQQRVIIARALAQKTDIMLLDEPISHLDIHQQIEILDTIKLLSKKITVIAVLHDLNLAAQYSDYLILVNKGSIYSKGAPEEVLTKENIKQVYDINVCMIKNPVTGKPHIIPIK
ncbi:ABC transporter ATP-binding protein [Clostridium sp. cel8]|jgi:iron complex transport system ATP-binding protein|uniref:ABC transporter ATP-binding protein n=1 Tax=unclassified Clostridium TaxID=2614128 RepID=UPI0015F6D916|nr:ABC transporter ATP-binding protein [Clostridium sp. cel8]MBA5851056.1 ABC transporter ATP-binding protein [Clostridium sp. cel8]